MKEKLAHFCTLLIFFAKNAGGINHLNLKNKNTRTTQDHLQNKANINLSSIKHIHSY